MNAQSLSNTIEGWYLLAPARRAFSAKVSNFPGDSAAWTSMLCAAAKSVYRPTQWTTLPWKVFVTFLPKASFQHHESSVTTLQALGPCWNSWICSIFYSRRDATDVEDWKTSSKSRSRRFTPIQSTIANNTKKKPESLTYFIKLPMFNNFQE